MNEIDARPIAYDICCGLGDDEALLDEGYRVIGFDVEAHDYGTGGYPGELRLRDITTIHGSELKDAAVIVCSPPCQRYSYMAMPWSRAKDQARMIEADTTGEELRKLNLLFDTCFRLQREASEAAGHHIPMIVENVRGAQKWVGPWKYNYGSFHLWGDVPALMPVPAKVTKSKHGSCKRLPGAKGGRISGWPHTEEGTKTAGHANIRDGHSHTRHPTNPSESNGVKQPGIGGPRQNGKGDAWFQNGSASYGSKSMQRKASAAMIAKIPYPLASHIASVFKPRD